MKQARPVEPDAQYLAAVAAQDWDTAQRMVDEAAHAAGYTVRVFHGTDKSFRVFKPQHGTAIWFSEDKDRIASGSSGASSSKKIMELYLNPGRVAGWEQYEKMCTHELVRDYDSAKLDSDWVIYDPSRVKSADIVVKSKGQIVPLSRRFNPSSPRIGESLEDPTPEDFARAVRAGDFDLAVKMATIAAETQRAEPEGQMLETTRKIQAASGPPILVDLLEHIGDLAHRAQRENALGNVAEKIRKVERTMEAGWMSLEEEVENGFTTNAETWVVNNTPELRAMYNNVGEPGGPKRAYEVYEKARKEFAPQIAQRAAASKKVVAAELAKYVASHEQFNRPVTKLGLLGKQAAILLGKQNYSGLRSKVREIRKWLDEYSATPNEDKTAKFLEPIAGVPVSEAVDQDAQYLAAVKMGDMKTAQKMVDAAARKKGYRIGPVYHGTNSDFNVFNKNERVFGPISIHLAVHKKMAETGGRPIEKPQSRVITAYVKGTKRGTYGDEDVLIPPDADYVMIENFMVVVRDPNQVKSADPVTKDDKGKIIPLSKRFNSASPDIRY